MQALVYNSPSDPIAIEQVPIPEAEPGSTIVKVIGALISPNFHKVFGGAWPTASLPPAPFTISAPAIARVHAVGIDATCLKHGQLVLVDFNLRSRDSPSVTTVQGYVHWPGVASDNLAKAWKHGTLAEYARMPLENVYPLNEELLLNELGYTIPDLLQSADCFIATAGLIDVCKLQAGDTLIVAPSTGRFGGCVVQVALAMGARVIAAGRTQASLDRLAQRYAHTGRVTTVTLTGLENEDTAALRSAAGGDGADSFVDMSPWGATVTHIASCIQALRRGGRAGLLGGDVGSVSIPYIFTMTNDIRIQGSCMFKHHHVQQTLKIIESGLLKLGSKHSSDFKVQAGFKLTEMEKAYTANEDNMGFGNIVIVTP